MERNKGHGRIETRKIQVSAVLAGYLEFPYVRQVFKIERTRTVLRSGETKQEVAYGITSLPVGTPPARILGLVRGQWRIENKLHWVRDVTFDEDRSQIRTKAGPRVMASLRNLAIGLFRLRGYENIAQALRKHGRDPNLSLEMIGA